VVNVRLTWWWQLIKDGGYLLEKNESYSGATICYTGYNDEDYSPRSFITRIEEGDKIIKKTSAAGER